MTDIGPTAEVEETTFDALPESVVASVLDRWGYSQSVPTTDSDIPEPGDDEQSEQSVEPDEADEAEGETPAPPGGPIFTDEPDAEEDSEPADEPPAPPTPTPASPTDPLSQLLTERLADNNFRDQLLQLLLGQPGQPQPPAPAPESQLPQITEEDLENPAVRASLLILNQQREQLAALQSRFDEQSKQTSERNAADLSRIAESAVHAFQTTYNLSDELIARIRTAAGPMTAAASQMTNSTDPHTVMGKALELAYWADPETRKFEFDRQASARDKALARRNKLGGVGGNSGSAARTPPPPDLDTREGRFDAAVAEVTAAMFGNET